MVGARNHTCLISNSATFIFWVTPHLFFWNRFICFNMRTAIALPNAPAQHTQPLQSNPGPVHIWHGCYLSCINHVVLGPCPPVAEQFAMEAMASFRFSSMITVTIKISIVIFHIEWFPSLFEMMIPVGWFLLGTSWNTFPHKFFHTCLRPSGHPTTSGLHEASGQLKIWWAHWGAEENTWEKSLSRVTCLR